MSAESCAKELRERHGIGAESECDHIIASYPFGHEGRKFWREVWEELQRTEANANSTYSPSNHADS